MTLAQAREFLEAAERRRIRQRTEMLVMLRAARYDGKAGARAFQDLLKASRTAQWLTPS